MSDKAKPEDLLSRHAEHAGHDTIEQLHQLAKPLAGLRVVHVNSTRRGGGVAKITFEDEVRPEQKDVDLIELHDALDALAKLDPGGSRVVELRYFGGLSIRETAEVLGTSESTVKREWAAARAWLFRELKRK